MADLYGAQVTVYVPGTASAGAEFTRVTLTFMEGARIGRSIEIPLGDPVTRPGDYKMGYVATLTENEPWPETRSPWQRLVRVRSCGAADSTRVVGAHHRRRHHPRERPAPHTASRGPGRRLDRSM